MEKVQPIKQLVIPLGNVRAGAPDTVGQCTIRFDTPSRRIHWMIQIGWVGTGTLSTQSWSLYPVMVDPFNGSQETRLQPVVSGATLPDGYEAESGVKRWEADINLGSSDTEDARIFAVMTWEPAMVDMCENERIYWQGLCNAARVTKLVDIGGSL